MKYDIDCILGFSNGTWRQETAYGCEVDIDEQEADWPDILRDRCEEAVFNLHAGKVDFVHYIEANQTS